MSELSSILIAALTGLISGILLSIPVGPVNLTIMNEGAQRGLKYAALVGLGASLMEILYCSLAFTGFAAFFSHGWVKTAMEVFSFLFMIVLGTKFLLVKSVSTTRVEARLEKKFQPHSAFMIGFICVLGNPGILLLWTVIGANFLAREWVMPTLESKSAFIAAVAVGTNLWFCTVGYAVSRGHKKFSDKTLLRMERGSGIGLLLLGFINACQIVWQLTHARHEL